MRIKTRQQRQRNAGSFGGLCNAGSHFREVGIRRAVAIVVEVVEFADAGKALFEHLDIQQRRNGGDIFRRHRQREAIHRVAPGPERIGSIAAQLGQPRHAALECVAVQARQPRKRNSMTLVAGGRRHARRHLGDRAGGDHHLHVIGPARRQERGGEMQSGHDYTPAGQNRPTIICLDI
ncbi:hypothetical protein ACVWXQ_004006 [Bradyrhizobium sp. S3.14.4]